MGKGNTVADLEIGKTGVIKDFTESSLTMKLLEMGFLPGETVKLNFRAPFGDPLSVRVSGYDISLRIDEACLINLE